MRSIIMLSFCFLLVLGIILAAGYRDNTIPERKFDCRMLIGGWHPDVPSEVLQQCRKAAADVNRSQTNYR
jgi:hypothetical protein